MYACKLVVPLPYVSLKFRKPVRAAGGQLQLRLLANAHVRVLQKSTQLIGPVFLKVRTKEVCRFASFLTVSSVCHVEFPYASVILCIPAIDPVRDVHRTIRAPVHPCSQDSTHDRFVFAKFKRRALGL